MPSRLVAAVLLALTLAARVDAVDSLPKLIQQATPGVVTILGYNPDKALPGIGTGFLIAPDRVITARHVIAHCDRAVVRTSEGKSTNMAGILAEMRDADLVLVQLKAPVEGATPLKVATDAPLVGERIFAIGAPLGLEFTASDGIVSAYRDIPVAGVSVQHTVPVSVGSSGCPILNDRCEVIAVQTGVITAGQKLVHAGEGLNFAVSAKLVSQMREGELRTLAAARDDLPSDWKPQITKGIDTIGMYALTKDDFKKALVFFLQSAQEDPQEPDVWFRVGMCYEKLGDKEKAVENYKKAIGLKPDFALAMNNLGSVYISMGQYADAAKVLNEAIKARADYAGAYGNLAVACVQAKNWEGARAAAKEAIRLNANDAESHLNLGTAALRLNDRPEAERQEKVLRKQDVPRADRLKKLLDEAPATQSTTRPNP